VEIHFDDLTAARPAAAVLAVPVPFGRRFGDGQQGQTAQAVPRVPEVVPPASIGSEDAEDVFGGVPLAAAFTAGEGTPR